MTPETSYELLCSVPIRAMGKPKSHSTWSTPNKRYYAWQRALQLALRQCRVGPSGTPLPCDGLVCLCQFKRATRREHGEYKREKPDVDNIQKALLDSLWGSRGLYQGLGDDNRVAHIEVIKTHAATDRMTFFRNIAAPDIAAVLCDMVVDAMREANEQGPCVESLVRYPRQAAAN